MQRLVEKQEEKKKRFQTAKVLAVILQGIYSCTDVWLSRRTLNLGKGGRDWVWGNCQAGWYWWLPRGQWKARGVCVWAGNSCGCNLMTTCFASVWSVDRWDLSSLPDLWTGRTGCRKYPKHLQCPVMRVVKMRTDVFNVIRDICWGHKLVIVRSEVTNLWSQSIICWCTVSFLILEVMLNIYSGSWPHTFSHHFWWLETENRLTIVACVYFSFSRFFFDST